MKSLLFIFSFQCCFIFSAFAQLTLIAEDITTNPNNTISVPIQLATSNPIDILGFQFTMNWDANLLEYESIGHYGITSMNDGNFGTPDITSLDNKIIVTWQDYPNVFPIINTTHLFTVNFTIKDAFFVNTSTEIGFCTTCATEFYDENINPASVNYQPGQVNLTSLPIELWKFEAQNYDNNTVKLEWITMTETQNSHFDIQHSIDSKNWQVIGKVQGHGTTTIQQHYSFLDQKPTIGDNFYRLKQHDVNGNINYSTIKQIMVKEELNTISSNNPVQDWLHIKYTSNQSKNLMLTLYDVSGKMIEEKVFNLQKGENTLEWNLDHLSVGLYWVKTLNNTATLKVIKT